MVGVDYYTNMGGSASDWLSDSLCTTGDHSLCWRTVRELAENFEAMVSALDHFANSSGMQGQKGAVDLLRKWQEDTNQGLTVSGFDAQPQSQEGDRRIDGKHYVSLDRAITTMRDTGRNMKTKHKETARGGLAVNVVEVAVSAVEC